MALWAILVSNFIAIIMSLFGFAADVTPASLSGGSAPGIL